MIVLFVLALVAASEGRAGPEACTVSEWGPWGDWMSPNRDTSVKSFPVTEKTGQGELMRERLMEMKRNFFEVNDYDERPTEGPVPCVDGYIHELECLNIDQQAFVSMDDFLYDRTITPSTWGTDMWGWIDPLNQDEYAIMCTRIGTTFFLMNDPQAPVVCGQLTTHGTENTYWRDVKVIGNYAYIVSELADHGVQVFDLTRLRGAEGVQFTEDAHYPGVGNCHNIVANEDTGYLYAVGCTSGDYPNLCGGGLHIINAADPLNLQYEGCFGDDGYVHDAQCVTYTGPDTEHQGSEICFCYNEDTFTIVDVTDKANMVMLSRTSYTLALYTHQGWLTEDQTIALVDDELDEVDGPDKTLKTYVWDVTDLDAPFLANTHRSHLEAMDHNQYIRGGLTYQSNYNAGLRILSLDQPTYELTEVAYLDTSPNGTNAEWEHGATWSVYPYYNSPNIGLAVSHFGLFILLPDYQAINAAIAERAERRKMVRTRSRDILQAVDESLCPPLVETEEI